MDIKIIIKTMIIIIRTTIINIIIIMKIIRKTPDELTISMIFSLTSGRLGGYSIWECNGWSNDGGGLPLWGKGDYYYYPFEGEVSWSFSIVTKMMTLLANLVTDVKGVQIWLRRCGCKHHWLRNHVLQPWCHVSQKRYNEDDDHCFINIWFQDSWKWKSSWKGSS